ncbi:phosphoglycolate phosphatase [Aurantimonas sp. C2-6-R+9]|uniref:phosphoglycolate phosphatase n=1 Tax=unclassified Aurantimonas TaxID=2638230 RepID=UPI002E1988EE|nr:MULTISPECIES: phosphoglycolate phosphatase [unclassified Aurantimonas]MEC5292711.1 phosphoglycolate phosphatase [Aurantimonas sp. C2-3-R2]MEC5382930.1 phosphoglycolate phosphatase [Aurantimonas sp. C2-6-R+9]MEC5413745.1 phosphoglycolate phosphatase [Aurantimonas sp. C2-4-R8]
MAGMAWPKAVLFDLDGTLVDSAPDIHASLNQTLASYGEPPFTLEAVTRMIGGGVPKLIERAYAALGKDIDPASRDKAVERFLAIYEPRATELTTLTAGASEATRVFKEAGVPIGVVTNKPEAATREILAHFGLLELLDVVVGGDAGPDKKPAPGLLLLACERLGLGVADVVFVGDSENDVEAAVAAKMTVIAVRGGYTAIAPEDLGADALVDRIDAVPAALETIRARADAE